MTRKDYETIAQALRGYQSDIMTECHDGTKRARLDTLGDVAEMLADIFEQENPRFLRRRFLAASTN
jgi:hypothetical protein